MSKVIEFKKKIKPEVRCYDEFMDQLWLLEQMYLQDILDKIIIIGQGPEDKACCSTVNIDEAKKIIVDFYRHSKEYIED
ncbi:MAG: hypothetical protein AB6733_00155 [Clostridiaceae bacterium]